MSRERITRIMPALGVGLVIMLFAWQASSLVPSGGLDGSWQAGIWLAAHHGVSFGDHAIFTYGPLGFLATSSVFYSGLSAGTIVYLIVLRLALAMLLFVSLRRTFGVLIAFVIAVILAQLGARQAETVTMVVGLVVVLSARDRFSQRQLSAVATIAGASAGLVLLTKLSTFPSVAAMTIVFVLTARGKRGTHAAGAALGFLSVFLIGWFASGQPLGALPDYVANSAQIASGYAAAMSVGTTGAQWQGTASVVALALGLWGALHMTETAPARQRWGTVLIWLAFWFFAFKEGFVRHDQGHATVFFAATGGGFAAFSWKWTHRIPAVVCTSALVIFFLAASNLPLGSLIHPIANTRHALRESRDALSPDRVVALGRRQIKLIEPIDNRLLSLLAGHTTAAYPSELAVAWAYGLKWDPVPVLQSYSAYTSGLDRVDADFLRSAKAPQRILLRKETGTDGRLVLFDQGETNRTMLCYYRQAAVAGIFAVLERTANRCGSERALSTVRADWGQSVSVPGPPNNHSLVFVRIDGVQVSGFERVRAALFKPAERAVTINRLSFRLVEATAADGLPLRASPGYDFSPPFSFAPGAKTIAALKKGQGPTGGHPIRFSFYSVDFSRAAG